MSRYIDAEWLKDLYKPWLNYEGKQYSVPVGAILANIDEAPTIDLVRCRECRWYDDRQGCFFSTAEIDEDGFCSYGERK